MRALIVLFLFVLIGVGLWWVVQAETPADAGIEGVTETLQDAGSALSDATSEPSDSLADAIDNASGPADDTEAEGQEGTRP